MNDPDFETEDMFRPLGPVEVPYIWHDEEFNRDYFLVLHYPEQDPEDLIVEEFNLSVDGGYDYDSEGKATDAYDWNRIEVERRFVEWLNGGPLRFEKLAVRVRRLL